MTIKDKVKHVMGLDRGHAGSHEGEIAHAYADDNAGIKGGPEVGSTGEGRTTGHGSGVVTSGATVGVGGMTAGNSGIHAGHRAALAKLDAEEAARKKPAPVVEVKEPVVEPVVEREVVREPVVERVSEPVYTQSYTPVHLSPVGDIPTEIPAGARLGQSTIISGPHNPHMETRGVAGDGLAGAPILGGTGSTHTSHTGGLTSGLTGGNTHTHHGQNQGLTSGSTGTGSGYRRGAQTDSSSQPGMVDKLKSAVGLGGDSTSANQQQTGGNSGYNSGSTGLSSGSAGQGSGYGQSSGAPYGVQAGSGSSGNYGSGSGQTGYSHSHGVNDNSNYSGNTGSGGVTDAQGNPMSGTPSAGTDGQGIGGSMGQSETKRSTGSSIV